MDINEFSKFIHKFATLDRESKKNGGGLKIKIKDTKEMIEWLDKRVA